MGTTNTELIELAKRLSIPNFHCICKDKINGGLSRNTDSEFYCPLNARIINFITILLKTSPTNIIVILNDTDKNLNGHWCLCFINTEQ